MGYTEQHKAQHMTGMRLSELLEVKGMYENHGVRFLSDEQLSEYNMICNELNARQEGSTGRYITYVIVFFAMFGLLSILS